MRPLIAVAFTLLLCLPTLGDDRSLTISQIESLIQKNDIRTIEDLLGHLPKSVRESFTLMHDSESSQGSSFEKPRVILFNSRSPTILTFNGDAQQNGGLQLEMAEAKETEWEFRRIQFPSDPRTAKPVTSEKNPAACTKCHESPAPHLETL